MPTNYTPLTNGQFATAAIFNAPLTELDDAIEHLVSGSKAMATPAILSFANGQHTHQNAAGGGQLDAAAIASGTFNAARIPTLDASKIGTGVFANALINWASPSAIGSTTQNTGRFSAMTVENASTSTLTIRSGAGQIRGLYLNTNSTPRWLTYADTGSESGSNAGSDFKIARFNDAGSNLGDAMVLNRATGNATFLGTVSKGGGSFLIDHPLDPLNRNLIHSFVEGPRADLVYRGTAQLSHGQAQASIDAASGMTPGTFVTLTKHTEAEVWVQNQSGYAAVRAQVVGGMVEIECQNAGSNDLVAWLVIAERNDPFYQFCDLTDDAGQFLVEVAKAIPTADELQALEPIEADVDQVIIELVPALIGKQGYAIHAQAHHLPLPTHEVRPIKHGGQGTQDLGKG